MKGGFIFNAKVRKGLIMLALFAVENKSLLRNRYTGLLVDLLHNGEDCVGALHLRSNRLALQVLGVDLHFRSQQLANNQPCDGRC